ncbi:hypothetical protein VA7868_01429 [Vibrio aerogenes CECT 7868]|uniref:Uncharacterized protein n=1 Tax=Vibrio aerogenes CECT 7868 TaxID=1216006 RepID=A0A1M5Y1T1_9VIBR|nr:hypothetical protein [Vibrio aerogenes]SHI05774.1 hypothetical protein VA7868_01429 [Vibrio aerogenes CECT 7868]
MKVTSSDYEPYVGPDGHLTERSQELFIIRKNGQGAVLLRYNDYVNKEQVHDRKYGKEDKQVSTTEGNNESGAQLIEWCYNESNHHFFFETELQLHPINLTGPALTKVTQWNLDNAIYPEGVSPQALNLQPGYLLDLRILQMNRILLPTQEQETKQQETDDHYLDTPIEIIELSEKEKGRGFRYGISFPPADIKPQLTDTHINENLYIVSFANPLKGREAHKFYPYHIHYVSAEQLDKPDVIDFEEDQETDLNTLLPSLSKEKKHWTKDEVIINTKRVAAQTLARYYRDAGVQTGAINPLDVKGEKTPDSDSGLKSYISLVDTTGDSDIDRSRNGTICMIANLHSFLK